LDAADSRHRCVCGPEYALTPSLALDTTRPRRWWLPSAATMGFAGAAGSPRGRSSSVHWRLWAWSCHGRGACEDAGLDPVRTRAQYALATARVTLVQLEQWSGWFQIPDRAELVLFDPLSSPVRQQVLV